MRSLDRDRIPVWIKRYTGKAPIVNHAGRMIGMYEKTYSTPVLLWATVRSTRNIALTEGYGISENYSRTITIDDPEFEVSESDLIFLDTPVKEIGSLFKLKQAISNGSVDIKHISADYFVSEIERGATYVEIICKRIAGEVNEISA